eukprot:9420347-Ditylum_brightwellii.AAC.1
MGTKHTYGDEAMGNNNPKDIKHCLMVSLKQKLMHSSDIRNYIVEQMEKKQTGGRQRGTKWRYRGNNKKKKAKRWKQKDIRDTVTGGGQGQKVRRKKTRKETTAGRYQQNAVEEKRDKGDTIKQT